MAGKNSHYTKLEEIGNRRVHKLMTEYKNKGFFCYPNLANNSGVDLIVMTLPDHRVVKVIECTNYAREDEWICDTKFERYLDSLNYWKPIERILVVSYRSNLSKKQIELLENEGIYIQVEGCQD